MQEIGRRRGGRTRINPGYFFVAPLIIVMIGLLLYPILKAALMSVQYWYMPKSGTSGNYFVGLDNFLEVFRDRFFLQSVTTTAIYMGLSIPIRYVLGLATAMLLNTGFRGRGIARSFIIIPWAVPEVVACLVWILMYELDFGLINHLAMSLGIIQAPLGWLTDTRLALGSAIAVAVWKGFPFVAIMLLSGLQSIPDELYEASSIDGASAWGSFVSITLPSLKPVSIVVFLLLIIWSIKDFGIIYLLARGGPSRVTEILTVYIYKAGFSSFDFGKAAAAGMIMLLFSAIFTVVYLNIVNRGEDA